MSFKTFEWEIPCAVSIPENACRSSKFLGKTTILTNRIGETSVQMEVIFSTKHKLPATSRKSGSITEITFLN